MRVIIIAVGKMKDNDFARKISDYLDKIRHNAKIEIVEIKDSTPVEEGKRLCEALASRRGYSFALTEEGKLYASTLFAYKLEKISQDCIFVIGGPFGLDKAVKANVNELLSLSPMTFPHELARLLLVEQLYRTQSILTNSKYHK